MPFLGMICFIIDEGSSDFEEQIEFSECLQMTSERYVCSTKLGEGFFGYSFFFPASHPKIRFQILVSYSLLLNSMDSVDYPLIPKLAGLRRWMILNSKRKRSPYPDPTDMFIHNGYQLLSFHLLKFCFEYIS